MEYESVIERLIRYVGMKILNGEGGPIERVTPLLEWGLINSIEIRGLVGYLREEFGITVEAAELTPANFKNVETIANLVMTRTSEMCTA